MKFFSAVFKAFVAWSLIAMATLMWEPMDKEFDYPIPPGSPQSVMTKYDCWSGKTPSDMKNKIPGHVVYADSDEGAKYGGVDIVHKALEQAFNGTEHGITIYGFCR